MHVARPAGRTRPCRFASWMRRISEGLLPIKTSSCLSRLNKRLPRLKIFNETRATFHAVAFNRGTARKNEKCKGELKRDFKFDDPRLSENQDASLTLLFWKLYGGKDSNMRYLCCCFSLSLSLLRDMVQYLHSKSRGKSMMNEIVYNRHFYNRRIGFVNLCYINDLACINITYNYSFSKWKIFLLGNFINNSY